MYELPSFVETRRRWHSSSTVPYLAFKRLTASIPRVSINSFSSFAVHPNRACPACPRSPSFALFAILCDVMPHHRRAQVSLMTSPCDQIVRRRCKRISFAEYCKIFKALALFKFNDLIIDNIIFRHLFSQSPKSISWKRCKIRPRVQIMTNRKS